MLILPLSLFAAYGLFELKCRRIVSAMAYSDARQRCFLSVQSQLASLGPRIADAGIRERLTWVEFVDQMGNGRRGGDDAARAIERIAESGNEDENAAGRYFQARLDLEIAREQARRLEELAWSAANPSAAGESDATPLDALRRNDPAFRLRVAAKIKADLADNGSFDSRNSFVLLGESEKRLRAVLKRVEERSEGAVEDINRAFSQRDRRLNEVDAHFSRIEETSRAKLQELSRAYQEAVRRREQLAAAPAASGSTVQATPKTGTDRSPPLAVTFNREGFIKLRLPDDGPIVTIRRVYSGCVSVTVPGEHLGWLRTGEVMSLPAGAKLRLLWTLGDSFRITVVSGTPAEDGQSQ
jgi:hypothetical protein